MNFRFYILFSFFLAIHCFSQKIEKNNTGELTLNPIIYKPLAPAKAAFYSAVLPGAGQIYNNRYWWQLPLIYGGFGTSMYFYITNTNNYNRYRKAYKLRKAGFSDEFDGKNGRPLISSSGLESAQKQTQQNRDFSLLSFVIVYALQIIEASVTAHLLQFDTSNDLTIQPTTIQEPTNFDELPKVGLRLKYSF